MAANLIPEDFDDLQRAEDQEILTIVGAVAGATQLLVGENLVHISAPASGTHTITLPKANENGGHEICVLATTNATGTITIVDGTAGSRVALADIVLTALFDFALVKNVKSVGYIDDGSVAT